MIRPFLAVLIVISLCPPLGAQQTVTFRKGSTMYVDLDGKVRPAIVNVVPSKGTVIVLDKKTKAEV